ncbi:hypothetical protein GGTG_11795 [Gaeumannomyces tritici R3-111a-1]|uniref:Methyltransferase domain-containing protein n=1 Tax=Gaeumannomyces tritici (strain R3-111a-1) TaxID=644352 RepID=J3PE72_GAET3|nr:hypothetical protein GGTG_11795 [Gaeumannomyces tritici R3-111a-1]EJT70772.1 hypothetical protein GGTG_11795 [Gaeumannomyces tritici R3-111a-1]
MSAPQDPDQDFSISIEEIPERLDEQHDITTRVLGFLIHPNIPITSPTLKVADVGCGTGIWLLDVAKTLPPTCQLVGYDKSASALPPAQGLPPNVTFHVHDMLHPFPESELGTYDVVAVRFVSSASTRAEWARAARNLATLLRPGGWLQWIDSCNFSLYCSSPGTPRAACAEIYAGLAPFRASDDLVIGLFMREPPAIDGGGVGREEVLRGLGLADVQEDVFSTDRLRDGGLDLRARSTRNIMDCFVSCLEELVGVEGSGWDKERIARLRTEVWREIDAGVYHTLDHVCLVGRKAG